MNFSEADMYPPIKKYFEAAGYTVTAEVKGADVTAIKSDELIILELKKQFNVKLLFQGIERQKITDMVYIVLPKPKRRNSAQYNHTKHIIKSLGMGLITVAMDSALKTVEVVLNPEINDNPNIKTLNSKKRAMLLEIAGRSMDANTGGSSKTKLATAYREKCIKLACALYTHGPMSAKDLVKKYNCEANAYKIMYSNHYKWFVREKPGIWNLTKEGAKIVEEASGYEELVGYYKEMYQTNEC